MSIRVKTLDKAVAEAKRFIDAAAVVKRAAGSTEYTKGDPWYCGGQYCAAAIAWGWLWLSFRWAVQMSNSKPPTSIEYRLDGKFHRVLKRSWT